MDISDWNLYYKIHETELRLTTTQMCYEPRLNPEKNVFCMNFCYPCDYQLNQPRLSYTKEHVDYTFNREIKYLKIFENKPYSPEILDISENKIFIKWYGKTCNNDIYEFNNLNCNWYNDLKDIIIDQYNRGYIKATVYPHSHYYDDDGQMRTIDFYATVEKDNPYLMIEELKGLIGFDTDRFDKAKVDDRINVEDIFKSGLTMYSKWPKHLTEIYNTLYGNQ